MSNSTEYDIIIAGGSYAGLAAAMALGRAMRRVLVIDSGNPCNKQTPYSHNFLTNDGKRPAEIVSMARQQLSSYEYVTFLNDTVTGGQAKAGRFEISTRSGKLYNARKLVFATGIRDLMPDIPGFVECWGISLLHCPYCHGYEVRHQNTGIIANGDAAFELSSLISNWTKDLALYTNGKSTLTDEQALKLREHSIDIVEDTILKLEHEDGYVKEIVFRKGHSIPVKAIYIRPAFVQHSSLPEEMGCQLTDDGYIQVDPAQRTSIPGIFACGDNTSRMRTIANAVASGTSTGFMLNRELIEEVFNHQQHEGIYTTSLWRT